MKIDERQVRELAEIAAIELKPDEVVAHRQDLQQMVDFVSEKFTEIDTTGLPETVRPFDMEVKETYTVQAEENRLRDDNVTNRDQAEELTSGSPDRKGSYIRVPRAVER